MTSPTLILLRLDVRHAADELRWAFWAAGTDLADERDAIDRIYQLYIVLIMMGAIASCWMFALDTARSAGAGLTGISASICMLALHLAPLVALVLKADEALRGCPVHITAADIAWLSRSIPKGLWVASSVTKNLVSYAAVAACCGYLLGTFGESAIGTQAAIVVAALMCLGTPIGAALGNAAGLARMIAPRRRRLAAGAILAIGAAGCWGLGGLMATILRANTLAPITLPPQTGALCASACAMGIAPLVTAARAARMDRIIDANSLYADMHSLRHLRIAPGGGAPYRKLLRIRRLEARRFRSVINIGSGMLAPVSRAFISHVRQPMPLLSAALFWGVIIIPWYAVLATTAHHFMMNLVWLVLAIQGMESAREVTRVFTEDCRNRIIHDALPFGRIRLLLADSALAASILVACAGASTLLIGAGETVPAIAVRLLICAGMTLSLVATAIYDDPSYKPGAKKPGPDVAFICLCAAALLACGMDAMLGAAVMIIAPASMLYLARR